MSDHHHLRIAVAQFVSDETQRDESLDKALWVRDNRGARTIVVAIASDTVAQVLHLVQLSGGRANVVVVDDLQRTELGLPLRVWNVTNEPGTYPGDTPFTITTSTTMRDLLLLGGTGFSVRVIEDPFRLEPVPDLVVMAPA